MDNKSNQTTWTSYQDAWADITAAERQSLLSGVAPEVTFASPAGTGSGLAALILHIEEFQKQYPGFSFRTYKMLEHHGVALADWNMYDKEGKQALTGRSFVRFDAEGRIVQLAGFWEA